MNKVPVSTRALEARIKRALAHDGESLHRCRENSRAHLDFGDYYVRDTRLNIITDKYVDIEELARELNLLKPYEEVVD